MSYNKTCYILFCVSKVRSFDVQEPIDIDDIRWQEKNLHR